MMDHVELGNEDDGTPGLVEPTRMMDTGDVTNNTGHIIGI